MGLLDILGTSWDDPKTMAALQLAGGLLGGQGNTMQRLAGGLNAYGATMGAAKKAQQEEEERKQKMALVAAQVAETQAQAAQRLALAKEVDRKQTEAEAVRRLLVGQLTPTQPIEANAVSGIAGPRPEALAAVGAPRRIDAQALVAQGVPVEQVKALMESPNYGRVEVSRTVQGKDAQGRSVTFQFDKFGQQVGKPIEDWKDQQTVDFGGQIYLRDPITNRLTKLGDKTQTPDSVASNRLGWANYGLSKDRLTFDQAQPKNQYDAERGLMVDTRTGTATPVMQAGQPLGAKPKDTPVEFKKSVAGLNELENGLKSYEAVLQKHGTGVTATKEARAELRGAFTAVQMGLKNAMELGALAGPDLDLLNGMLLDPTSPRSVFLGSKGLQQQIDTARDYLGNRGRAVYEAHQQPVPDKYLKPTVKSWKDAGYQNEAAAIQDAQNAILKGANKAAVLKRLSDMGITNPGIN